jgi:hypothetical protein
MFSQFSKNQMTEAAKEIASRLRQNETASTTGKVNCPSVPP